MIFLPSHGLSAQIHLNRSETETLTSRGKGGTWYLATWCQKKSSSGSVCTETLFTYCTGYKNVTVESLAENVESQLLVDNWVNQKIFKYGRDADMKLNQLM